MAVDPSGMATGVGSMADGAMTEDWRCGCAGGRWLKVKGG